MSEATDSCQNCENVLPKGARYCPNCGQSSKDLNISFRLLLYDALDELFNVEGKHVQTFRALLFSPGKLTNDFIKGKRARYILPVRMFLFVSVIALYVQNLSINREIVVAKKVVNDQFVNNKKMKLNLGYTQLSLSKEEVGLLPFMDETQLDSMLISKGKGNDKLLKAMVKKVTLLTTEEGMRSLNDAYQQLFSYAQFLLMPFFALGLLIVFRSSNMLYVQHLVHAIHIHTILFLIIGLASLCVIPFNLPVLNNLLVLALVYALISLKNVYGNSWAKSTFKLILCLMFYMMLFVPLVMVLAIASMLIF